MKHALGDARASKVEGRNTTNALRWYRELCDKYVSEGMSKEEASEKAHALVKSTPMKKRPRYDKAYKDACKNAEFQAKKRKAFKEIEAKRGK